MMKTTTRDDYIQSVFKVVLYIEEHYNEALTLDMLSREASFSKFHFHRVFKSVTGESLGDYIRRVRLSTATLKFLTNQKITQIAMDSGYETNASFSKAFKQHYGMTPKEFSRSAKMIKGAKMPKPKFVELEAVDVLYVRKKGDYMRSCAEAWEVLMGFAYTQKIKEKKNLMGKEAMMLGVSHDDPSITAMDELRCDACISWDDKSVKPQGEVLSKTIEGGKYAMFLHKGSYDGLKNAYEEVADWIVQSGEELRECPIFEKYLNRDPRRTKPENLRTEIYVPIK